MMFPLYSFLLYLFGVCYTFTLTKPKTQLEYGNMCATYCAQNLAMEKNIFCKKWTERMLQQPKQHSIVPQGRLQPSPTYTDGHGFSARESGILGCWPGQSWKNIGDSFHGSLVDGTWWNLGPFNNEVDEWNFTKITAIIWAEGHGLWGLRISFEGGGRFTFSDLNSQ